MTAAQPYVDMPAIERRLVQLDLQLDQAQARIVQASNDRLTALAALRGAEAVASASLTEAEAKNSDSRRAAVNARTLSEQSALDRADADLRLAKEVAHNVRSQMSSAQTMSANFREAMRSTSLGRST